MTDMASTLVTGSDEVLPELTAHDRCDGCGGQARLKVITPTGDSELLFCLHHGDRYEAGLVASGWVVTADTRAQLIAEESSSSGVYL